ncbi:MAG: response regulator [Anaerolineales bacterium]|nr:response regulator [Anaerolineales bacterium]
MQTAKDGRQAMSMLEKRIPDLVVMDIMLPEIDGLSLTRWLRDHSNVPIIMVTARREEIDRIAGLEMGADDYVVKPFSPQELVSRVRAVLRRVGRDQAGAESEQALSFSQSPLIRARESLAVKESQIDLTAKEF